MKETAEAQTSGFKTNFSDENKLNFDISYDIYSK